MAVCAHRRPAREIDHLGTGGGAAFGTRTYLTPTIVGSWLYVYRQYREFGEEWVRYSLTSPAVEAARVHFAANETGLVQAAFPFGDGVIWAVNGSSDSSFPVANTAVMVLAAGQVSWVHACGTNQQFNGGRPDRSRKTWPRA